MAQDIFSLTQIRHLMRVEFSRAQRYSYPLGALVARVDGIDQLRANHGFELADDLVSEVSSLLVANTRACDYIGRLVDDRLVTVLPHTTAAGTRVLGERLVEKTRALDVSASGERLALTLSAGVTSFEEGNTLFFDALIDAAESAVDRAASAGGDRVVHLDPSEAG